MTVPGVAPTPFDGDPANAISFATILQWFDYWLAGLPEASLPPARVVTYEDRSERAAGSWAEFDQWPPAAATNTRLYPTADGELARELPAPGTTTYAVNPYDGPSACVIGCLPTDADQNQMMSELNITNAQGRYAVGGRTTFTTPAFEKDVVVSGPVYFQFRAALTADDTYFVSKLEVLTAAGQVLPLETGYLRAQTRSSLERLERITPGDAVDYRIALGHIHFRFDAGQSLRITIGGGDVPRVLPTSPAGIVSVHHGESTFVDLSLIGY
jgi:putative CocE/NonD family hydrolase